jgi:hypothetical protein
MDAVFVGIFALVSAALLWSNENIIASHATVLSLVVFILGNVVIKISKALAAPYLSQLRSIPGPAVSIYS